LRAGSGRTVSRLLAERAMKKLLKRSLKFLIPVLILGGLIAFGLPRGRAYWKARNKQEFREAQVTRGDIISVVNATGKVEPVSSVHVGSFVSGPIVELCVDFNDVVTKDQLLAKVDPRLYEASVASDKAAQATRDAEVTRVEALLTRAKNDEKRALRLRQDNKDYISQAELDQVTYACIAQEAQLEVAKAAVEQAKANLENALANLDYTEIRSPVSGIVIERKIDPGQTLAASFQTPELFVIAEEMDTRMFVYASVDEADIGLIRDAEKRKEKVEFTVDAYPDDLFEGTIYQVRINPVETQNVVTYPVVVEAPNSDMKLLPGMTANLSFQVEKREDTLKVPNAALRFYPKKEQVREENHKLLDGAEAESEAKEEADSDERLSAQDRFTANRERNRRHVWVVDGERLKAIEVTVGLSDNRYTQLVEGPLEEDQKLVTGLRTPGS
jgi:HlyD family secretion protein